MFEQAQDKALESAKSRALRILGSRQMSAEDMKNRLTSKGETEENATEAVKWLERIGAIDDVAYAASICSHYSGKGYGLTRVKDELFKRGIPRGLWDDAICSIEQEESESSALAYLEKKLRGSTDKDDLRKATGALCRRGYSYEQARRAVSEYLESGEK
ncbi:MAG: recombination regulator RecX [Oscillospiraceae bacterium]|nr:recombination regulator RecX [Oscillospiraceae bacterium]